MPYVQSIIVGTVNITEWMKTVEYQRIIFNTTLSDTAEYWGTKEPIDDDVVRFSLKIATIMLNMLYAK